MSLLSYVGWRPYSTGLLPPTPTFGAKANAGNFSVYGKNANSVVRYKPGQGGLITISNRHQFGVNVSYTPDGKAIVLKTVENPAYQDCLKESTYVKPLTPQLLNPYEIIEHQALPGVSLKIKPISSKDKPQDQWTLSLKHPEHKNAPAVAVLNSGKGLPITLTPNISKPVMTDSNQPALIITYLVHRKIFCISSLSHQPYLIEPNYVVEVPHGCSYRHELQSSGMAEPGKIQLSNGFPSGGRTQGLVSTRNAHCFEVTKTGQNLTIRTSHLNTPTSWKAARTVRST